MNNCAQAIEKTWRKPRVLALLLFAIGLVAMALWAQGVHATAEINWFSLLMGLLGAWQCSCLA